MARLTLLVIVPHPDDETFGSGGTLLSLLARGDACGVLTLTQGEAGKTLGLCDTKADLSVLRQEELRACLDVLGVLTHPDSVHEQHHYPDGAVAAHRAEVTQVIQDALNRHRPEIILTFPPDGLNGHPDHVATHQVVKSVWDELPVESRPTLWYYALNREWLDDPSPLHLQPNRVHDVSAFITQKLRAMGCHRSQGLTLANTLRRFPERVTHEPFYEVVAGRD
ncbi:PIG-L deacetylase family protein [Deinococcus multiflagellatus]|uniref:PIG-L deacetylase family protein n=1 Tax=Deinococcus multiflagellatus TaxID=1656887 RepID=A0ABW1ZTX0_9DEIO|nr:PIG-L deacetylase family protein [Deinococcus multiflagellatus]MBZ9715423.1 PIG-L family deacetylase [Deinococcus multiflagellatus]